MSDDDRIISMGHNEGDGFATYVTRARRVVIAWKGQWLEGSFDSREEALKSGREQVGLQ